MVEWKPAPNIAQIKQTVLNTPGLTFLGDIGNAAHLAGTGDHTPWSTHNGKLGTPTQGQVHAIDIGMSDTWLDQFETFVRQSWRRGELYGIKYLNVLNRQWNTQTETSWNRAKNGTITSTYNGDHHVHLSMENGTIDGNIITRFNTWRNNGQQFPDQEDDDMQLTDTVDVKDLDGNSKRITLEELWEGASTGAWKALRQGEQNARALAELTAKVAALQTGGVNIDLLAEAVAAKLGPQLAATINTDLAARIKEL